MGKRLFEWETPKSNVRQKKLRMEGSNFWSTTGVCLRPYTLYIHDMPDQLKKFCKMFADNAKIFSAVETTNDHGELQGELFESCEWGKE